jgi:hypothetical protein
MNLYVGIHQTFKIWFVPFYEAKPSFVTVLKLTHNPDGAGKEKEKETDERAQANEEDTSSSDALAPGALSQHGESSTGQAKRLSKPKKKPMEASQHIPETSEWQTTARDKKRGSMNDGMKYYIYSQEDLYQTNEWIKFVIPYGVGYALMTIWQYYATILCCIGVLLGWGLIWLQEQGWYVYGHKWTGAKTDAEPEEEAEGKRKGFEKE